MTPKTLIAGNWKMNGLRASLVEIETVAAALTPEKLGRTDVLICPPATLLREAVGIAEASGVLIGAQDCHPKASGAHTGDISAAMVADCGATAIIVGHSERRADHGEIDEIVRAKAEAAIAARLTAIICVGETEAERLEGRAVEIVATQLAGSVPDHATSGACVIAYEPVWAIGTGRTPTVTDVSEMHTAIRERLVARFGEEGHSFRILYGGSVKPSNAAELLAVDNVNGALVGGASLKAADFLGIIGV